MVMMIYSSQGSPRATGDSVNAVEYHKWHLEARDCTYGLEQLE